MIQVVVPESEVYNRKTEEFIVIPKCILNLEHSLISLSKWESKWKRSFLNHGPQTQEELIDYIRCMTLNKNVDPQVYYSLDQKSMETILKYLEDPMTATTFSNKNKHGKRRGNSIVTSEIIYWEMVTLGIPFECEKWNLNRLLTLIRVCNEKDQPPRKMSQDAILRQYAGVNAKRRKH